MKKSVMIFVAVALVVGLLSVAMLASDLDFAATKKFVRSKFPKVPQLSIAELKAWQGDDSRKQPVLLDTRPEAEFAVSHLHGAVRVEPSAKAEDIIEKLPKGAAVVTYCSVGYRSSAVAERLREAGVAPVYNLEGSIFEWANQGGPLEADGKPAKTVHPYNKTWGQLLHADKRAAVK